MALVSEVLVNVESGKVLPVNSFFSEEFFGKESLDEADTVSKIDIFNAHDLVAHMMVAMIDKTSSHLRDLK